MSKTDLLTHIIATLEAELQAARQAALEAAGDATDEEARPENKYDTRALEASYVASAQAHYAKDVASALQAYRNLSLGAIPERIAIGSLVTTLGSAGRERFFLGPARGGLEIPTTSGPITVLTPKSPLGSQLIGKALGDAAGDRKILRIE